MIVKNFLRLSVLIASAVSLLNSACAPPQENSSLNSQLQSRYSYVDPQGLIPVEIREQALTYFDSHQSETTNRTDFSIVSLSRSSGEKTIYHLNMQTGAVEATTDSSAEVLDNDSLIYTVLTGIDPQAARGSQRTLRSAEVPPLWEAERPQDGADWTEFTLAILQSNGSNLLAGSKDISSFCPTYQTLSLNRKLNFWAYLISAVTQYESGFKPTTRFREAGMGQDPITGQHVHSEGLLQLSYQDRNPYPFCNEFDWSVDRNLAPTDPKKTIFDPHKNLRCGIRILNQLVGDTGFISFKGHYWSTLKPRNSSMRAIQALTNKISFCQK
jgi:hypothetical protein